jgi:hypothetical protein
MHAPPFHVLLDAKESKLSVKRELRASLRAIDIPSISLVRHSSAKYRSLRDRQRARRCAYRVTTCAPMREWSNRSHESRGHEEEREDNLLCCQYVAHNDRLRDFSDTAIIVADDLARSSLA